MIQVLVKVGGIDWGFQGRKEAYREDESSSLEKGKESRHSTLIGIIIKKLNFTSDARYQWYCFHWFKLSYFPEGLDRIQT